jgi:hypothetical protein
MLSKTHFCGKIQQTCKYVGVKTEINYGGRENINLKILLVMKERLHCLLLREACSKSLQMLKEISERQSWECDEGLGQYEKFS